MLPADEQTKRGDKKSWRHSQVKKREELAAIGMLASAVIAHVIRQK